MTIHSKLEGYITIFFCIVMIFLIYLILYKSPNLDNLKPIVPLLGFLTGYIFYKTTDEMEKLK
jgi:hypothetical protein